MNESTIKTRRVDARWEVLQSWIQKLCEPPAPDWFALERDSRATRVKEGNRRTIWKVEWNGMTVFAKVADPPHSSIRNRWKEWLAGTSVEREWQACRKAAARGVPVVPALAVGVRRGERPRTVFLSESLADARCLLDVWEEVVDSEFGRSRRRTATDLIERIARFFADAHEQGFSHQDAHPSNILVNSGAGRASEAVFVDVHSARFFKGPTPYAETMRALAHFDQYFQRRATRTERLRFLRSYWRSRESLSRVNTDERARLADLAEAKRVHAAGLAHQRDRRLGRDGKYFSTVALGNGWRATLVCELERRHVFPEPSIRDRTEREWRVILEPLTTRSGVQQGSLPPACGEDLVIEHDSIRGLFRRLAATAGRSRHRRIFEACHRNRHRDQWVPLVLGFLEHRSCGLLDASLLIRARNEDGARVFGKVVSRRPSLPAPEALQ